MFAAMVVLFTVYPALALAAPAPTADDPSGLFELLLNTAKDQKPGWQLAVLVVCGVLLVWALRKFSGWLSTKYKALKPLSFFKKDLGGYILAVAGGILEVMLVAIAAGQSITMGLLWSGLKNAAMMVLAFVGAKKTGLIATNPPAKKR